MPRGMLLRSPMEGSHISDPGRDFTLHRFSELRGVKLAKSLSLEDFVRYGRWYQGEALADHDSRNVTHIEWTDDGYLLTLDDGDSLSARNVVIATGIGAFAHRPGLFACAASGTCLACQRPREPRPRPVRRSTGDRHRRRSNRTGIGGLAAGIRAEVEVVLRRPFVRYLKDSGFLEWLMDWKLNPFRAPGKIGPIGVNWLIEHPGLFTTFPRNWQERMTRRAIRPAGSSWLRPRNEGVRFHLGCETVSAFAQGSQVRLQLSDGGTLDADHILLGTGYRIDISRYRFLPEELLRHMRTVNGYPVLNGGFESSLPGLFFVGTTAAYSFGPYCRFVAGTGFVAETLARYAKRPAVPRRSIAAAAST